MIPVCVENKIYLQEFSTNIEQIQKDSLNTQSMAELFRGFINYYFNGGGFDHVHDVIDTRTGKIVKLENIPEKDDDPINGINLTVRNTLKQSVFGILEPFDYSYVPSQGLSMNYLRKDMLFIMSKFIKLESKPKPSKKPWSMAFCQDEYDF